MYQWQLFQIVLAFIDEFYGYDVIYDLIKGEAHVQNCLISDWLVYIYLVGHMIIVCFEWLIGQFWSYDQNNVPWQFSTELSSSGGIVYKKIRLFFAKIVWKIILGS